MKNGKLIVKMYQLKCVNIFNSQLSIFLDWGMSDREGWSGECGRLASENTVVLEIKMQTIFSSKFLLLYVLKIGAKFSFEIQ